MKNIILLFVILFYWQVLCQVSAADEMPPRLIIIDDDVGMLKKAVKKDGSYQAPWLPITDPDGGLELIYALREPSVKVLGITCTMGCSSTDVCMASVKKILELTGNTEVPVLRGAASPEELGEPTQAARFIIDTVMSRPGQVEIIATAPLTNIATAMMIEPSLPDNWKTLHLGTGEFVGQLGPYSELGIYLRRYGYQDLNINVDPDAARYVLEHGGNFIVYPNEIMDDAALSSRDRQELKKAGTPLSSWVASETWPFAPLMSALGRLNGLPGGMPLHGVIPVAVAIEPGLAEPRVSIGLEMEYKKRGAYRFKISADPGVTKHDVYFKVKSPEIIERRTLERCK